MSMTSLGTNYDCRGKADYEATAGLHGAFKVQRIASVFQRRALAVLFWYALRDLEQKKIRWEDMLNTKMIV